MSLLRPLVPADHQAVLALNERNVELLAPLDEARLVQLVAWAETAAALDVDGTFAGFVLTFGAGSPYDGENFAWFSERYPDFTYLDRVVIHEDFRRRGLGTRVYDELEVACGRPLFTLEVNIEPANEPSLAFHRARGFVDVGRRTIPHPSGDHDVTMMVKQLT
ncbi:MAG: GNAT family N-acetyltransferase [Marmoricola sp.]|nr:GNAT family N-acetyltransferase [Marmoricola sp.]